MSILLRLDRLQVGYGDMTAVHEASLEVHEGEVVALIGGNGAGKTTTLRAISGLLPLRTGAIEFAGQRLDGLPSSQVVARGIAHVPEGRQLFPTMSVREPGGRRSVRRGSPPASRDARLGVRALSTSAGAPGPARGDAVGGRAADVRDWAWVDGPSEAPHAGRAKPRPGAGGRPGDLRGPAADQPWRAHHPPGRTERAPLPSALPSWLRL